MRVVLLIAAIVAILIAAAAVSGGAKLTDRAPVDLEPAAPAGTEPYPVVFDPYTGWGVSELVVTGESGPAADRPHFEVDPFDRYGVAPPHPWETPAPSLGEGPLVAPQVATLVTYADVRAWYGDDPLAEALQATGAEPAEPVAMAASSLEEWPLAAPLDAK